MKHTIRFIILFFALVIAGAGNVRAVSESDIIINVLPNSSAGTVSNVTVSGMTVTFTANPASGYSIDANHITAEKMVDASAPRRAPGMSSPLPISGTNPFSFTIPEGYTGAYVTVNFYQDAPEGFTQITSLSDITDMNGKYQLTADVSGVSTSLGEFKGTLDGGFHKIIGLSAPLFTTVNGGTIKNVMLEDVKIKQAGPVGAIAGTASGYSRIYNCGILPINNKYDANIELSYLQSIDGYCGGLVGWLKDDSRVINCFSYANVTGGTDIAGIVGHNEIASTAAVTDGKYANLRTAVVNCMFYGNLSGGTNTYPVYGGAKMLNNTDTGINSYDFYRSGASVGTLTDYNCSWPAEEKFLIQYEFHRNLLNSNRELCGWWVGAPSAPSTMSTTDVQAVPKDASLMAKWVLDPCIAPYPILKPAGYYPSPVNRSPRPGETNPQRIDSETKQWVYRASSTNTEMKNPNDAPETDGRSLGKIKVTIKKNSGDDGTDKDIIITAMDVDNNDFCYGKIQLPYYNSIFGNPTVQIDPTATAAQKAAQWNTRYGGNYGDNVVVGWEITGVTGGTEGTLTENWQDGYNFTDRNCTAKDKERVFAQGGYYYVPYGVSAITITAKWATAIYLDNGSNHSYDRVNFAKMDGSTSGIHFAPAGARPSKLSNGKTVITGNIKDKLPDGSSVYDNAIVLVGNHQYRVGGSDIGNVSKACTIMSADFDLDDEPDYSLLWQLGQDFVRKNFCPIRFDFIPVTELGLAMKLDGSTQYFSLGSYRPLGHFEVTETSLIHFGQFEFSNKDRTIYAPLILNGGIYDQYTKGHQSYAYTKADDKIDYVIVGGNVRMPSFTPGAHVNTNASFPTRHCAVNVLGGSIDYLYLTGNYNNGVTPNTDNPHCYIDGGNFKQVAAAGKEGIDGDVYFNINHSIINEFYGGSTLADKLVTGSINVTVNNSFVTKYCGGPKFGDMNHANNKTVTTNATGTTFGVYYGGGNGGTSYVQYDSRDNTVSATNYNWTGTGKDQGALNSYSPGTYRNKATGYQADYEMEIVNVSTGTKVGQAVHRTYFYAAQFSATNTGSITNNLTDCKVLTNFYGGGNLGGVKGDVTSKLMGTTHVDGSAFGAGYSASIPEVKIYNKDKAYPTINVNTGIITPTPEGSGTSTTYTWTNKTSLGGKTLSTSNPKAMNVEGVNYLYTEESLDNLGSVSGTVNLLIEGSTTVGGSVFGGGEESDVLGNTRVEMTGGYVFNGIFGGGYSGSVGTVTARSLINYDGTAHASHSGCVGGKPTAFKDGTGKCTVVVTGGQIGPIEVATQGMKRRASENDPYDPVPEGWVWGGGCGVVADPADDPDIDFRTYVKETDVTIGGNAFILESIIGGGEFGRVLGNTNVTIEGNCQIGVGAGKANGNDPIRYTDEQWTAAANAVTSGDASAIATIAAAMPECSHFDYGRVVDGKTVYETFDPYYDKYYDKTSGKNKDNIPSGFVHGSTSGPSDGKTWIGCVFGGGSGYMPYEKSDGTGYGWVRSAGLVEGNTSVEIKGGHVLTNVYGGNEVTDVLGKCTVKMTGGTIGVPRTLDQIKASPFNGNLYGAGKGDPRTYFNEFTKVGSVEVDVSGGIIYGSVYGGGEDGHVTGNVTTTIRKETGEGKVAPVIGCDGTSGDDGNVFGAGQGSTVSLTSGVVSGNVTLNIQEGIIKGSVYGGGQIGSVGTYVVRVDDENYGKMKEGDDHGCLTVNLTGGTIEQNVYGGCMGTTEDVAFGVSKNVAVNLNGYETDTTPWTVADDAQGCAVMGSIFGCNNVNSSPEGTVTVHVYGTQHKGKTQIANTAATNETAAVEDAKTKRSYDVAAVYGGGNMAAYVPKDLTTGTTNVIIDGCGRTSIQQVYGGGNAASTPATSVTINGTYEIEEVFGGGNGKDAIGKDAQGNDIPNPGANVGFKDYSAVEPTYDTKEKRQTDDFVNNYVYGTGKASVNIFGGTVHCVFGGSNTKGNVRQTAVTLLDEASECEFHVDEAYGGGKSAPMDAEAKLLMACIPGLSAAYGGAEAADIQGNVTLNITNGTFKRVFGGNNESGTIRGSITVNIEEIGCKPIIIGELYGGGNQAGYSVFGYKQMKESEAENAKLVWKPRESLTDNTANGMVDNLTIPYRNPEVNVKSFTSIGTIFGGGYGATATMAGSPTVNINVVEGDKKHYTYAEDTSTYTNADNEEVPYFDDNGFKELKLTIDGNEVVVPKHEKNKIGAINKVFGGGNAAKVIGNTNVNIGTLTEVYVVKIVGDGDDLTGQHLYTRSGAGTTDSPYTYTEVTTGTADPDETYYEKKDFVGVDIRGDVYGGGNNAEVTGNTNVNIGKKEGN